jgi:RNA-directed DNA polymerase
MGGKRQNNQLELAFMAESRSETPRAAREGTEPLAANCETESPAKTETLMEEVLERENMKEAMRRVKANKGSAGIDGMSVQNLAAYLVKHWPEHREQLLQGTYQPQAVKRVEIPKPDGSSL